MEKLSQNRPSITKLSLQNFKGSGSSLIREIPAGSVNLISGSGATLTASGKQISIATAAPTRTSYHVIYNEIVSKDYAPWMSASSTQQGLSGTNGDFLITSGKCVQVGVKEESGSFNTYGIRNICPPCLDCGDFREGEGSPLSKETGLRMPGLFDLIDRLDEDAAEALDLIVKNGGRLDQYKEVIEQFNKVMHLRAFVCEAELSGRVMSAGFKWTNVSESTKSFDITISFPGVPARGSRCVFVDRSTSGDVPDPIITDDSAAEEWDISSREVRVRQSVPSGESIKAYASCYVFDSAYSFNSKDSRKIRFTVSAPTVMDRTITANKPRATDSMRQPMEGDRPWWAV